MSLVLIDNYDSFTYNLKQYLGELYEGPIFVFRNDQVTIEEIKELHPNFVVLSPGPGNPTNSNDFGICSTIIKSLSKKIPTLGVCLGHQGIGFLFGMEVIQANEIRHGKVSTIYHNGKGIFQNIENPIVGARYHSLILNPTDEKERIFITARTENKEIMAIQHAKFPIYGLQFHPESILTPLGKRILANFLEIKPH